MELNPFHGEETSSQIIHYTVYILTYVASTCSGDIAQLVEHRIPVPKVASSSLAVLTLLNWYQIIRPIRLTSPITFISRDDERISFSAARMILRTLTCDEKHSTCIHKKLTLCNKPLLNLHKVIVL